ncbi:hypothetical protein [Roseomonas chloroacetimidivorans]|jgi:2-polyprenyl-6-methoxyphenol hydroxylase-like FAD-dependent oxidoreductase|uniref:FAD binding domain-containing protein n=1 Tax=Roseomonas chloroacetimidivorans TaxID=1766656 RepID=UPI003C72C520
MQVSWNNLYRSVRARLEDGSYILGQEVSGASNAGMEGALHFANGRAEAADVVIGAECLGSVLRGLVTGTPTPNAHAGYVARRGLVSEALLPIEAAAALLDGFAFQMVRRSHILGYSVTGPGGEIERGARRYTWVLYRRISAAEPGSALTDVSGRAHPYSLAPGQLPSLRTARLREAARALLPPPFSASTLQLAARGLEASRGGAFHPSATPPTRARCRSSPRAILRGVWQPPQWPSPSIK